MHRLTQRAALCEPYLPEQPLTPFERKYVASDHRLVLISDNCSPDILLIVTSSDSHSGSCPVIVFVEFHYRLKEHLGRGFVIDDETALEDLRLAAELADER